MKPNDRYFDAAKPMNDRSAWQHTLPVANSKSKWQRWMYAHRDQVTEVGRTYIDHNHPSYPKGAFIWSSGMVSTQDWQVIENVNSIEEAIGVVSALIRMGVSA